MKTTSLRVLTTSLLVLLAGPTFALTVPVAQDTSSTAAGKLAPAAGKAATLTVTAKQTSLIRFDLSDTVAVPTAFQPGNIKSATLRLYVVGAKPAADVLVRNVTTDWQERFTGVPVALPTIQPAIVATIPAAELLAKNFVNVDVTAAVIAALQAGSDFGFALQMADTKAKVTFASKEGAASGYAAELEISANTAVDGNGDLLVNDITVNGTIFTPDIQSGTGTYTNGITASTGTFSGALTVGSIFKIEPRPNSTGAFNNFIGVNAGASNTTGAANNFLGQFSGLSNTTGGSNTFLGHGAGNSNTTGNSNTFVGTGAGSKNVSGSSNICVGLNAGFNNLASQNVFVGSSAGALNATGGANVFVGFGAGGTNVTGSQNSFFGINAGNLTTASFCSFFGAGAGQNTSTGIDNSAFGNIAGFNNTTGQKNTFYGANTGLSNTVEDRNTFIGEGANGAAGITNSTALGQGATVTASNAVVLGNNCSVGIGVTAPNSTLQVNGSMSVAVRSAAASILIGLTSSDCVLIVTGAGASNVGLPTPVAGRVYIIKNRSTGTITLGPTTGSATIDGNASITIAANTGVAQVVSDGTNWFKIN